MNDDEFDILEIEKKRDAKNAEAESHRLARDNLNDEARCWIERRDLLNGEARAIAEEANEHRKERDRLNEDVRKAKEQRDKFNRNSNELFEKVNTLKREKMPKNGIPLGRLKKELRDLENRQMTSVLTVEKERELIEQISKLAAQIKAREKELEENAEVKTAIEAANLANAEAEKWHKVVEDCAENAQREHEDMTALYEKCDAIRREADIAQENFIKAKLAADEEHKKHVELIKEVHDYDKIIVGRKLKQKQLKKEMDETSTKKQAEEIFERFKQGEKLTTEDMMTLQKSGYI